MNCHDSVLGWLSTATKPVSAGLLAKRSGFARTSVGYTLRLLLQDGEVERVGERGSYKFRLTGTLPKAT